MKRIDQAEINYIFANPDSYLAPHAQYWLTPEAHRKLTRSPIVGVAAAWNHKFHRSGLSPFTMHYLIKEKMPVRKWTEKYLKKSEFYSFCYGTNLPVINNFLRMVWETPGKIDCRRIMHNRFYSRDDRDYYYSVNRKRDDRFNVLHLQLEVDKAAGLVDDEYMRNFGGHPIKKDMWQHLKGVAGIYL